MQALGYETRAAYDGPSALTAAQAFAPDVALIDLGLPVMDGYELAHRITDDPRLRHIKLVAVTGYGQRRDREASKQAGFAAHLVKPVDTEQLRDVVTDLRRGQ
jgi:CheY-like chemotaxis protein